MTDLRNRACSCKFCNTTFQRRTVLQALSADATLSSLEPRSPRGTEYPQGSACTVPVGLLLESALYAKAQKALRQYPDLRRLTQRMMTHRYRAHAFAHAYTHLKRCKRVHPRYLTDLHVAAERNRAAAESCRLGAEALAEALGAGLSKAFYANGGPYFLRVRLARHDGAALAKLWYERRADSLSA